MRRPPSQFVFAVRFMPVLGLLILLGCSNNTTHPATVAGAVTLDNKLVSAGSILLMTEDGHAASTEIKDDGTFTVQCPPGMYRAAVFPPPLPDPMTATEATIRASKNAPVIPKKYQDVGTSGLMADVKVGANTFEFQLKSSAK